MTMGLACDSDGYDLSIPRCKRCGSRGCQTEKCADLAMTPTEPVAEAGGVRERIADAIDAARYAHPTHPRERDRPFAEADRGDREYAFRLADAALRTAPATSAPATRKENTTMAETEIQRLQREITERQSRLAQLVLGDQTKSVGWPPDDVNPQASGLENCCEQEEGA